jgi:predicted nucleic acid-binding protein
MEALDANVVLGHFTGQPPELAARATAALVGASPRTVVLANLTVADIVFVLQGAYERPRGDVVRWEEAALAVASIAVDNEALLPSTREHYSRRGMDWPDACLVALVETVTSQVGQGRPRWECVPPGM